MSAIGRFIVIALPIPIPKTPHALYRLMFLYIVAAFGIGWFLPVNVGIWSILLMLALILYLRIRALARGEKRFSRGGDCAKNGVFAWEIMYLIIAVMGMAVAFYGGTAASYDELREARGIVPAEPYNESRECRAAQAGKEQSLLDRISFYDPCRHTSSFDYLPFPNGSETLHLSCAADLRDGCDRAYAHAGKEASVKYSGSRLYEMEVDGVKIYRYADQSAGFARGRKAALLDSLIAVPLFALPLMWFHRRFDDWQEALDNGETVPDETPLWWKLLVLVCWYLPFSALWISAAVVWWRIRPNPVALTLGLLLAAALLFLCVRGAYHLFYPPPPPMPKAAKPHKLKIRKSGRKAT